MRVFMAWITLSLMTHCFAGVGKDMMNFFNKFGTLSNASGGSAFKDQQAGYLSGGSLFVRNPVRSQPLVSVTMPGYRMGCGGIDLWAGGLSYINGDGLRNIFQSIVSNMGSHAFMLAVETYAPQIHTIMQQLNKLAADFNRLNINSCEASAALLGGVWPRSDQGSQAVCRMLSSSNGGVGDWASARHQCGAGGQRDGHLARADQNFLVGEFNLAWKILEKLSFLLEGNGTDLGVFGEQGLMQSEGQLLKEIFMTLSGTIISRKAGENEEQVILPSKADQEEFLTALMQGGKIKYYKCDEPSRCLRPTLTDMTLSSESALQTKILNVLEELAKKVRDDDGGTAITEAEMALINATHLPIYKIINVSVAFNKGRAPINIVEYAELIAFDITFKYINDVFDLFLDGVNRLKTLQFTNEQTQPFLEGVRHARHHLNTLRGNAFARVDMLLGFMQKTQMIEKQIFTMVGSVSNEYGI